MLGTPDDGRRSSFERAREDSLVPFRCDVLYVEDHAVVVARGEVDIGTSSALLRQMSASLALPITRMTIDLAYVTFIDSSGVNALVVARKHALERRIEFRLESVPRQARSVLEVCDLLDLFGVENRDVRPLAPADRGHANEGRAGRATA
jgi:anti-sigma B factor antagonist